MTFSDDFNRANAATLGSPWVVADLDYPLDGSGSTWSIDTNRAYCSAVTEVGNRGSVYIDGGSPDGTLEVTWATVGPVTDATGLAFRIDFADLTWPHQSYYLATRSALRYVPASGVGGWSTSYTTNVTTAGDVLTVVLNGGDIEVKLNGTTVAHEDGTFRDTSHNLTSQLHGMFQVVTSDSVTRYDDFSWTPVTTPTGRGWVVGAVTLN